MIDAIACPHCQRKLKLPETLRGSEVCCPACMKPFVAGAAAAPAVPVVRPVGEAPARPQRRPAPVADDYGPRPERRSQFPRPAPKRKTNVAGILILLGLVGVIACGGLLGVGALLAPRGEHFSEDWPPPPPVADPWQADEPFAVVAEDFRKNHQLNELAAVVDARAKIFPNDPVLPFYRGELYVFDGRFDLADKAFAKGMANPPAERTVALFRNSRVQARYYTGQALSAYETIAPQQETFQQLAQLCFYDDNLDLLEKLLAAHDRNQPNNDAALRWRCRLRLKQDRTAEGIDLFKTALAVTVGGDARRRLVSDFLYDMVDAGKAVEGYAAAPDARDAFQTLGFDLLETGRLDDLRALLDAHRKGHADDPWLVIHLGSLHAREKAWDKAAAVLGEAWKTAPENQRQQFAYSYVQALYRVGRALDAYAEVSPQLNTYRQLVELLVRDKKGKELEGLIAVHRVHGAGDLDLPFHEARAKILLKQFAAAAPLFRAAYDRQPDQNIKRGYVINYVLDMAAAGRGLEAYRAVPDKLAAFETLARQLVFQKKTKELSELLDEHAKFHMGDMWLAYYRGEWHLLAGNAEKAEWYFVNALANAPRANKWQFQNGLSRARIRAGNVVAAYTELGANKRAFDDLAHICKQEQNAAQLEELVAARRQTAPDAVGPVWEVELCYLKKDYNGALKLLADYKATVFSYPNNRWLYENLTVRCLVKLKRSEEAVQQAEAFSKKQKFGNTVNVVFAHAATGDVKRTIGVVAKLLPQRFLLEDCYRDGELGAILRSDAFRAFRERFPEPAVGMDDGW